MVTSGKISCFYGWVVFQYIYLCHIFFTYSSVDGHLGCFHVLATVNNAAMTIGMHVSFPISVFIFFRYIPRSRIAGHMVVLYLVFWGTSILLSTLAAPIYTPTNSARGFPFLHLLANMTIDILKSHMCVIKSRPLSSKDEVWKYEESDTNNLACSLLFPSQFLHCLLDLILKLTGLNSSF